MKLLWGKHTLFQSPSPTTAMLETSRFARPAVCAAISNAGYFFFSVVFHGHTCGLGDQSSTKADKGLLNMQACSHRCVSAC